MSVFTGEPCKKKRYKSEATAQTAIQMMKARGGWWAKKFVAKSCDLCGGFHVGKPEPEKETA